MNQSFQDWMSQDTRGNSVDSQPTRQYRSKTDQAQTPAGNLATQVSSPKTLAETLAEAEHRLDIRDWDKAAQICERVLSSPATLSPEVAGRASHCLGEAHFQRAFESNTRELFEQSMRAAAEKWESAAHSFEKAGMPGSQKRALSRGLYSQFWLHNDSAARRNLVNNCIALAEEAVKSLAREQNLQSLAETKAELLSYLRSGNELANNYPTLKEFFEKGIQQGREAIEELTSLHKDNQLLDALYTTFWIIAVRSHIIVEPSRLPELVEEGRTLAAQLGHVSDRLGTPYASILNGLVSGDVAGDIEGDPGKGIRLYEQAANLSGLVRDSLLLGRLFWVLTISSLWQGASEEYAEGKRKVLEKGVAYGSKALDKLGIPFCTTHLSATYAHLANCYFDLARYSITDPEARRTWLNKAVDTATRGLGLEAGTWACDKAHHILSRAEYTLATFTEDREEKIRLLREALRIREEEIRIVDNLEPHGWDRGIGRKNRALIKTELADLERNQQHKLKLLEESAQDMKECLEICNQRRDPGHVKLIAIYSEEYGDTLSRLHKLTGEGDVARSAIAAFEESARLRASSGQAMLLGSVCWKIAREHDSIADFHQATTAFGRAAENYRLAAQKSLGAADTIRGLAGYMDAWACIERARQHHDQGRYTEASAEYAKASNMLQATRNWNHLAKHYAACSLVEKGEAASQRENLDESTRNLKQASETFHEAKNSLELRLQNTREPAEKTELSEWLKISGERARYSKAKSLLEEARLLDRQEKNEESAKQYREASESFKSLANEQDSATRAPLERMMLFCQAWATMKIAQVKFSPELYRTAASLFLKAEKSAGEDKIAILARANSLVCKSLATATGFRGPTSVKHYSKLKAQFEAARVLYYRAGFEKAAEWARATERFYDATSYFADAQKERTISKKRELYLTAERNLESAGRLYAKAGFKGRAAEAKRLLQWAKEEGELSAPLLAVTGDTLAFQETMPAALLRDQPLGLERFEAANIVGNVKIAERILKQGFPTTVELELTNAGRKPATLLKVEGVPPEGLEIDREKMTLPLGRGFVDLKGKRLDHSKSYSLTVVLKGDRRGVFEFRPRIVTADETGNLGVSELDPTTIIVEGPRLPENLQANTIKNLGSRTLDAPKAWFETPKAKEVFQHLAKEFLTDYMGRGLNVDSAGWRTMMRVVSSLRIPRSAFYGPEGRDGAALAELDRRGLVERRVFTEERGRGGAVTKVRVAYETPAVRSFLRQAIVESI